MNGASVRLAGLDILGEVGRGSRTVVYRVRGHGGVYAMKAVQPWVGAFSEQTFRREAALLASVEHPGVARVHEVGTVDGRPYLVMDFVEGQRLAQAVVGGPLPLGRVLSVGIQVADALGAAHRAGIVHRDVKPDNIVLAPDGRVRVIDFGLALGPGESDQREVAGTLLYCAPEQSGMLNRAVDSRSDLYALGAVLFESATGQPPFESADLGALLRMQAGTPAPDPRDLRPELPAMFAAIVGRLLAKDPDDRYQSCAGLAADLRRLAADPDGPAFVLGTQDEPVGRRADYPLVGRRPELARLLGLWEQAKSGTGQAALITGNLGLGASRLAREVVATVGPDAVVLTGLAHRDEPEPLAPVRSAIDRYIESLEHCPPDRRAAATRQLVAAAGSAGPMLRALSPRLGALLGGKEIAAEVEHQQFLNAVTGFLTALAARSGAMLLYLDDVQWLDDATRSVLQRLMTTLGEVPLLVLATGSRQAGGPAAARGWLAGAQVVRLEPQPARDIADLVAVATGGIHLDPAAAADLAARGGGNPFTVLQYLTAAMNAGLLRPSWGTWLVDAERLQAIELPADAIDLILGRLDSLDPRSRHLLGFGAVVGPRFAPDLVAQAAEVTREQVVAAADAAAWQHIVERSHGGQFYAFLHDRIRLALLAQLDDDTRRDMHERVARVLDTGPSDPATVFALARHCQLGDAANPARVFRTSMAAGQLALAEQGPAEALAYFSRAAEAATEAGIEPDPEFLVALAQAEYRTGRFADAVRTLRLAQGRSDDPMRRAAILHAIAQVYDNTWDTDGEIDVILQGLAELGRPLPRTWPMVALTTLGQLLLGLLINVTRIGFGTATGVRREYYRLLFSLQEDGALAYGRELWPFMSASLSARQHFVVGRLGTWPERARLQISRSYQARMFGLQGLARRDSDRADASAKRADDPRVSAYVAWLKAYGRQASGDDQGQSIRQVLAEHAQWLDVGYSLDLLHVLCWDALLRGDRDLTDDVFERRRSVAAAGDQSSRRVRSASEAGFLALRGRDEDAHAYLEQMRTAAGPRPTRWASVEILYGRLIVALETYDLGSTFDEAAAEFEALGIRSSQLIQAQLGIYLYLAYGRLEQCRTAADEMRPARLGQARAAVAVAARVGRSTMQRAHAKLLRASLLQIGGANDKALRELNRIEPELRTADATLLAFEVARVRARALRALQVRHGADRELGLALGLAVEQGWPYRAARFAVEFGRPVAATARVGGSTTETVAASRAEQGDRIALSRLRQRLDAIQQVGRAASRVLDPAKVITIALDEIIRIFGPERAFLFLVEGHPPRLVPHGGRDADGNDLTELTGYSSSLVERARATNQAFVITGTDQGAALGAESVVLHGLRSIMVAPLELEGRLLGIVYLDSRVAKGIFTEDDVGVLAAIANHIAVALETARASQLEVAITAANNQRDVAESLRASLTDISGTLVPERVLHRLLATVLRLTGSDAGWLVLRLPDPGQARLIVGREAMDRAAPAESVIAVDEPLRRLLDADGATVETAPRPAPDLVAGLAGVGSWMAVPLDARADRLGMILLADRSPDAFERGPAQVVAALVGQGMVAYENARLFAQVELLATIDPLTGVANRRHFFALGEEQHARARQSGRPLAAMMVDIDHFKEVNDEHGHQAGDEAIKTVAARLTEHARSHDLVGRYGGEEFAILLPGTAERAPEVAERLRLAVADEPVPTSSGPIQLTISVGVAYLAPDDTDVSGLLARADHAMYAAKGAGRNRVESIGRPAS